VTIPVSS